MNEIDWPQADAPPVVCDEVCLVTVFRVQDYSTRVRCMGHIAGDDGSTYAGIETLVIEKMVIPTERLDTLHMNNVTNRASILVESVLVVAGSYNTLVDHIPQLGG